MVLLFSYMKLNINQISLKSKTRLYELRYVEDIEDCVKMHLHRRTLQSLQ